MDDAGCYIPLGIGQSDGLIRRGEWQVVSRRRRPQKLLDCIKINKVLSNVGIMLIGIISPLSLIISLRVCVTFRKQIPCPHSQEEERRG